MRYFDGQAWTNHYHEPGKLPAIGNWINTTFSVFGEYWRDAAVLSLLLAFFGNIVIWVGVRPLIRDLEVVDEELFNASSSTALGFLLIVLFAFVWPGFSWLAMSRFMQRAHFHAQPTVVESLQHASRRLPAYLVFLIALMIATMLVLGVIGAVGAAVPLLGLVLLLFACIGGAWLAVRLAFLVTAIAVAPRGASPVDASVQVSAGRFWEVLGRLLLLIGGLGVASYVLAVILGDAGQFFDFETLFGSFVVQNEELTVTDFRFADLLPSPGLLVIVLLVNSVIQAVSNLISSSAVVRLYLDSGGESEL